jgi:nitroimidazol reductase NimA-like FMN-containing flavoprotein (pyridoxamine 5'-phosphate oxidase superfamily)
VAVGERAAASDDQMTGYQMTDRTRLRRMPERGAYDRATVHAILDEGFVCHAGFEVGGRPYVLPTGYARVGETLYLHGSSGSRLGLQPDVDVCVTVTLLDGLVLARAAFHHSMAYRSVMVFGRTRAVTDPQEKDAALTAIVEHIAPGRSAAIRPGNRRELVATVVLALDLDEVSAKARPTTAPKDEEEDYALPMWAGLLPLTQTTGEPVSDPRLAPGTPVPEHVTGWRRPAPAKEPGAIAPAGEPPRRYM